MQAPRKIVVGCEHFILCVLRLKATHSTIECEMQQQSGFHEVSNSKKRQHKRGRPRGFPRCVFENKAVQNLNPENAVH